MCPIKASRGGDGQIPPELRRCMARVLLEYRESLVHGRPITPPNLRRLFDRYWRRALGKRDVASDVLAAQTDWAHGVLRQVGRRARGDVADRG